MSDLTERERGFAINAWRAHAVGMYELTGIATEVLNIELQRVAKEFGVSAEVLEQTRVESQEFLAQMIGISRRCPPR